MSARHATLLLGVLLLSAMPAVSAQGPSDSDACRDAARVQYDPRPYDHTVRFAVNHSAASTGDVLVRACVLDGDQKSVFQVERTLTPGQRLILPVAVPRDDLTLVVVGHFPDFFPIRDASQVTGWASVDLDECVQPDEPYRADLHNEPGSKGGMFQGVGECEARPAPVVPAASNTGRVVGARPANAVQPLVLAAGAVALSGVLYALWKLLAASPLGFLLYTRLHQSRLLDQEMRNQIHEVVRQEPGIRLQHVGQRLELPQGVLRHHVRQLLAHQVLREIRRGRRRHLFTLERREAPLQTLAVLSEPSVRRVYDAIRASPGQSLSEVAAKAQVRLSRASKVVSELGAANLVRREHDRRSLRLYPA